MANLDADLVYQNAITLAGEGSQADLVFMNAIVEGPLRSEVDLVFMNAIVLGAPVASGAPPGLAGDFTWNRSLVGDFARKLPGW